MKQPCSKCNKMAVWLYLPAHSNDTEEWEDYFCDEHVPRGCNCNLYPIEILLEHETLIEMPEGKEGLDWKWKEKDVSYIELDGEGRELPCIEYLYDEKGFDKL